MKCGDLEGLEEFVARLQKLACCPIFADKLDTLVKDFNLKGLKEFAQQYSIYRSF